MVTLNGNDIVAFYSGGEFNTDPNKSIGGGVSNMPISSNTLNNLFSSTTDEETKSGKTDYRAIYIYNVSNDATFKESGVFVGDNIPLGSSITIGVNTSNDQQELRLSAQQYTGGNCVLSYMGTQFTWNWALDFTQWAINLRDGLNALPELAGGVTITVAYYADGLYRFNYKFEGADGKRNHPLVELEQDNLLPSNHATPIIVKIAEGSPINSIVSPIATPATTPFGVNFVTTSKSEPIMIGDLRPGEFYPVWIKRNIPANSQPVENDSVRLSTKGRPF